MNFKDCYVRPLAWRGSQQMGLSTSNADVNVAIAVWDDWSSYFKIEDRLDGLKLITSPYSAGVPTQGRWDDSGWEADDQGRWGEV